LKARGPSGAVMWGGTALLMAWGFYRVGQTNQERNAQKLEERQVRYAMAPLLQAESDNLYLLREIENLKREREVMKNVEGWKVGASPYNNSEVWMPRAVHELSRHNQK